MTQMPMINYDICADHKDLRYQRSIMQISKCKN
jgi:hypothetical protein